MTDDPSNGWEGAAAAFARLRSGIGTETVSHWSACLPRGASIVDIGCGTGVPIARALADLGFSLSGIDPSPTLLAAFRRNLPGAATACEPAETSGFLGRQFDAAIAIGVLFLLPEERQRALIAATGRALRGSGHFLFTAPRQACTWTDSLTGRESRSAGEARYRMWLAEAGLVLLDISADEGGNDHFHARRAPSTITPR